VPWGYREQSGEVAQYLSLFIAGRSQQGKHLIAVASEDYLPGEFSWKLADAIGHFACRLSGICIGQIIDKRAATCHDGEVLSMKSELYPIRAASKLTRIPAETMRAWERRYQAVVPARSARGRMYSDPDVQRLLLLRACLERGHAIGQVAALSDAGLQNLLAASLPALEMPPKASTVKSDSAELKPLLQALQEFDYGKTNHELSRLALLLSPSELVYRVVLPVMTLAGENWENGSFSIAQGHLFSACVRSLLGGLIRLQRPAKDAVKLLMTTPANELHEFGILSAALLALAQEFPVAYLGPNLPASEILSATERSGAKVVVLGIMQMNATPSACAEVDWIASRLPATTELWLGGTGALAASRGVIRPKAFQLEDLPHFERQLMRLKADHSRQVAL